MAQRAKYIYQVPYSFFPAVIIIFNDMIYPLVDSVLLSDCSLKEIAI